MAVNILGVKIDDITRAQACENVRGFLAEGNLHTIFTPNPEMIVDAQRDDSFKEVLNSGSLNICDGVGVQLMSRKRIERNTGVDFMFDVCKIAEERHARVFLLGSGNKEVLEKTKLKLLETFPSLSIVGTHVGPEIHLEGEALHTNESENNDILSEIIMAAPDILFVAFGHRKQEKWIDAYAKLLPSVKIAMGVGGAFDYISQKVSRAPRLMRVLGLEWLYRLIREPKRITRIFKAVIVFPILYIIKH